jgi:hypothetical protein
MKIEIDLGTSVSGGQAGPAKLDIEELLGTRLLIQGNSGSGKSHLLRRILETSAAHVQQGIIDPEGDFLSLADKFRHVVIDANRSKADLEHVAVRVRQERVSFVLDLSSLEVEQQMVASAVFLNAMFDVDREFWFPMLVAVDEAQLFAPAAAGEVSEAARRLSLAAMTNLMCRGRKRGLAGIMATQRLAKLAKNCAAEASNFLMGRTFLDIDMQRAADLLGMDRRQAENFRDLQRGQFMALGPALTRRPIVVSVGSVETAACGSTPKLTPLPDMPTEEKRDELLAPAPTVSVRPVFKRPAPSTSTNELLTQVAAEAARTSPEEVNQPSAEDIAEREHNLYEIAVQVLSDVDAAFHQETVLIQDFIVRCKIRRLPGTTPPMSDIRRYLNVARAGVPAETAVGPEWARVLAVCKDLPEDLHAPFLRVAAAAMTGAPCPSDADLARVCGTRSLTKAKVRLSHLDQNGAVVLDADQRGQRFAHLPDLDWRTAPGDPNAPCDHGGEAASVAAE